MPKTHSGPQDAAPFVRGDAAGDFIVHVDHPLGEARVRLARSGHGSLLVVDGDALVGFVAAGDLGGSAAGEDGEGRPAKTVHVRDVMRAHVPRCRQGASVQDAARELARHGAGIIAVLNDHDELVGVMFVDDLGDAAGESEIAACLRRAARVSAGEQEMTQESSGARRRTDGFGEIPVYSLRPRVAPD
ncbi:MAG: CBS domain-containing protein [Alphaproteobacteria bacterium]|nr:CBS domain-containing protein [Alphaproteobacteria bacterium]